MDLLVRMGKNLPFPELSPPHQDLPRARACLSEEDPGLHLQIPSLVGTKGGRVAGQGWQENSFQRGGGGATHVAREAVESSKISSAPLIFRMKGVCLIVNCH